MDAVATGHGAAGLATSKRLPDHLGGGSTSRPRLRRGVHALWRDVTTVQFGLDPARALVVGQVDRHGAAVLAMLDGRTNRAEIERAGGRQGRALLEILDANRLLEDATGSSPASLAELDHAARERAAPELAALALVHADDERAARVFDHRRASRVKIVGGGRIGIALAQVLAGSGLGRVEIDDEGCVEAGEPCAGGASPAHIGLQRSAAGAALVVRAMPPAVNAGPPGLVVFAPLGALPPDPELWVRPLKAGAAVLAVYIRETTAIVGPLHAPESVQVAGCPHCVHLHRLDRDAQWPVLANQLAGRPDVVSPTATTALVWAAVAAAASQVLAFFDRRTVADEPQRDAASAPRRALPSAGASLELGLEEWTWRRRWWGPHPDCACRTEQADPARAGGGGHD